MSLWVPKSARPAHRCEICEMTFTASEEAKWLRHMRQCISDNHDLIVAGHPAQKLPGFMRSFDPEFSAYAKRTGKTH